MSKVIIVGDIYYADLYPGNALPGGGQGGHPSQPIYHPGHPDHGLPPFPNQGLPGGGQGGRPSHPIHIPGVPDQGLPEGQPIPGNELPPIPVPPQYAESLVVGVKQPNSTEWTFTAYDTSLTPGHELPQPGGQPDQGLPPQPQPHSTSTARRR